MQSCSQEAQATESSILSWNAWGIESYPEGRGMMGSLWVEGICGCHSSSSGLWERHISSIRNLGYLGMHLEQTWGHWQRRCLLFTTETTSIRACLKGANDCRHNSPGENKGLK